MQLKNSYFCRKNQPIWVRTRTLLERFLRLPKDFTWDELKRLLNKYEYSQNNKGKTSGSRVRFEEEDTDIYIYQPAQATP